VTTSGDDALRTVRILGMPIQIWAKAQEGTDELIREFTLIALGEAPGERELPQRLLALLQQLTASYGQVGGAQTELLQRSAGAGLETLDELAYEIPLSAADAATELGRILDECDEYCRAGEHLLTLAAEDDVRAFRWWFLDEIRAQVSGEQPTPWAESSWASEAAG
jgi:hypothetical protein